MQKEQKMRSSRTFPYYQFRGTHRQIGQQYGEACADLIHKHVDLARERIQSKNRASNSEIEAIASTYRTYVMKYAENFDQEIIGISEGANITVGEAYLIQIRAEINRQIISRSECTTFAISAEATADGSPLIGQNADLPSFYSDLGIVAEFIPNNEPASLMLTPAGQISYIGLNNLGLGVCANFLTCEGWQTGFPRYMLSRLALTKGSVQEGIQLIRSVQRASSRNLIMLDQHGGIVDFENTPTKDALIRPTNGILAHSNHYISPELLEEERLSGIELKNSQIRLERIQTLLNGNHGKLNAALMQDILRDRGNYPHCICQMPGDENVQSPGDQGADIITFASIIAEPAKGQMWVAMGPPNQYEYTCYSFSR